MNGGGIVVEMECDTLDKNRWIWKYKELEKGVYMWVGIKTYILFIFFGIGVLVGLAFLFRWIIKIKIGMERINNAFKSIKSNLQREL